MDNKTTILLLLAIAYIIYRVVNNFKKESLLKSKNQLFNGKYLLSKTDNQRIESQFNNIQILKIRENLNLVFNDIQNIKNLDNQKPHRALRNINPKMNGEKLYIFDDDKNEVDLSFDLFEASDFEKLIELKLNSESNINSDFNSINLKGKIVGFEIGLTTIDGAPIVESQGFVDTYDIPPYDTWIYLKRGFKTSSEAVLFCWIPNQFTDLIDRAESVDIMASYFWLNEFNPELNKQILNI